MNERHKPQKQLPEYRLWIAAIGNLVFAVFFGSVLVLGTSGDYWFQAVYFVFPIAAISLTIGLWRGSKEREVLRDSAKDAAVGFLLLGLLFVLNVLVGGEVFWSVVSFVGMGACAYTAGKVIAMLESRWTLVEFNNGR